MHDTGKRGSQPCFLSLSLAMFGLRYLALHFLFVLLFHLVVNTLDFIAGEWKQA